jgi:hypothetical protein
VVNPVVRAPLTVTAPEAGEVTVTVLAFMSYTASTPAPSSAKWALRWAVYLARVGQLGFSTGTL